MADDGMRHRDYFQRREAQERRLAESSASVEGRCVHLDLADRYAALARDTRPRPILRLTI